MKAKALWWAAALAAGIGISTAQSTITNVSVMLVGGGSFNLICNPLNSTNNNSITNLFRNPSDGDQLYRWNPITQDIDGNFYGSSRWNLVLQPGEAVFYLNAGGANRTQTFVGEVVQTPYTNPVPFGTMAVRGNGLYNAYGPITPFPTSLTNVLAGLPPADGDQIYFWDPFIQDLDITPVTYSAYSQSWSSSRTLPPGIGFFYLRAGPDQAHWIRNFTAQ